MISSATTMAVVLAFAACSNSSFNGNDGAVQSSTPKPTSTTQVEVEENGGATAPTKAPVGAVSRGSFTAWTYPASPGVNAPYTIFTQVRLPPKTVGYTASDLSGSIRGSDGYAQPIGAGSKGETFEFQGSVGLLTNKVPGSSRGVNDIVVIRSALLKEEQTLTLTFGGGS